MKPGTVEIPMRTEKLTTMIAVAAVLLGAAILVIHLLTHIVFFDESIQIRYLWNLSSGLRPNVDFFCLYPTLGYILTLPFVRWLPESVSIVFVLRALALASVLLIGVVFYRHGRRTSNEWVIALAAFLLVVTSPGMSAFLSEYSIDHFAALAASGALLVFFGEPGTRGAAVASCLCLVSVAVMPKYSLPLFLGMLGYLTSCYLVKRDLQALMTAVTAASAATLLAVVLLFYLCGDSSVNNFRYAYLLNYRYNSAVLEQFGTGPFFTRTALYVADFYRDNPLLAVVTVLGLAGWAYRVRSDRKHVYLAGGGVLLGSLASTALVTVFCEQYILPVVLCLALFVPFLASPPVLQRAAPHLRLLFAGVVLAVLVYRLASVAGEFRLTPLNSRGVTPTAQRKLEKIDMVLPVSHSLKDYAELLQIVPTHERVVAAWPYHPLLRRDLTFHAYDDRPSISRAFGTGDPLLETFSPGYFRTALEANPPALIVIPGLDTYYPPGWQQVADDFLAANTGLYELYPLKMFDAHIRKDLLGTQR